MAAPLSKYGGLRPLSDLDIGAGADWRKSIKEFLEKAEIAVLLVSRHFLNSDFIMNEEVPEILAARGARGLQVIWVLVSSCLYEDTFLESIQAALPTNLPLEDMTEAKKNASLKSICGKIKETFEKPVLDPALNGTRVSQRMRDFKLFLRPSTRRAEIFVRADNSGDCYHQGAVPAGALRCTCYFGNDKTVPGTGFHIIAITTEAAIPNQGGKPTTPFPISRTRAEEIRVLRG